MSSANKEPRPIRLERHTGRHAARREIEGALLALALPVGMVAFVLLMAHFAGSSNPNGS